MAYNVWYNSTEIADRIRYCAKLKHISTKNLLSVCNLGINTISKIANGSDINSKNLAKIADCLECSVDFLLGRTDIPKLHKIGRNVTVGPQFIYKDSDVEEDFSPQAEKEDATPKFIAKQYFDLPASAGTGVYLGDESPYTMINLPFSKATQETDFVVRVSGDSMEPKFHDGDKLLIKRVETLSEGEIGIFILNGESYIKKLSRGKLTSLNQSYRDITFNENDTISFVGKVIGKVNA